MAGFDPKNYKKPTQDELKSKLQPQQFDVTQGDKTETAFNNKYWDNKREGIYVDVVSGEPLFSSLDKYDSGSGWPSFTKPLESENIATKVDKKLFVERTEVRSRHADSHLGHVFDDGPAPANTRYCINSASLRFIPKEDLEKEGYGQYLKLFEKKPAEGESSPAKSETKTEKATFAAGCFWGVQHILDEIKGVVKTRAGYTGGGVDNPTYRMVTTGETGHAEAVEVEFDPKAISYKELVSYFWRLHDPTQVNRQGPDVGTQYRSAIFYHSPEQREIAEASKAEFEKSGVFKGKVATQIVPAERFWDAEEYHQKYFIKNGGPVCHILRDK